jgi:hypothetical protein
MVNYNRPAIFDYNKRLILFFVIQQRGDTQKLKKLIKLKEKITTNLQTKMVY